MPVRVKLKEIRQREGLSQNGLARLMGQSLANIQRIEYENAKAIPLDTLGILCKILNCQPGDLLVWVPDEEVSETGQ